MASREGRDGCVQLLLDKGAQIDHQNKVSAFWDQPSVFSYHVPLCEECWVCGTLLVICPSCRDMCTCMTACIIEGYTSFPFLSF